MKTTPPSLYQRFLSFLLILTLLFSALCADAISRIPAASDADAEQKERIRSVVLDAGHGGEDGGAISASGIVEKDLNLQITFLLRDLLEANGIRVILTRTQDELLYDKSADYHGRKKVLDLSARHAIAQTYPNAVFLSIHMNTYPLESCKGLQVWYSANDARSLPLASGIQEYARAIIDPQNSRSVKKAGSAIYLLHHASTPAALVECGFLSNPEEAEKLADPAYQRKIALAIFLAIVHTEFDVHEA